MTDTKTIERIERLEAVLRMSLEEAIDLKKSLSPVKERATRKGLSDADKAKALKHLFKTR